MDSFFSRFKNPLVLLAIVLIQVIALAVQVQRPEQGLDVGGEADSGKVMLLRRWTTAFVTPLERVVHGSSVTVRGWWSNYMDLRHTRQQDTQLKLEVARLREEQAAFAEDAAQGRRLQALLQFKQRYIASTVAAQVIGTSGSDRSRVVYVDKGAADGLKAEQAVITPDGVVGKVRDVFPHTAQILLLSDRTSGAGVIVLADGDVSRIRGILRGTESGQEQINNLTADSRIRPGERVITSGGDMVFPRGLPVGVIESIAPDPQHQPYTAIVIKPAVSLSRLEEVLIVTGTESTLPGGAQQDAAIAEGLAQEKQRAADLVAERLPSLHESSPETKPGDPAGTARPDGKTADAKPATPADDSQNQIGGVPGVPNSGLPRTKPVLHPDRYSPGATPPADSLRPGAPSTPATAPAGPPPAESAPTPRPEEPR